MEKLEQAMKSDAHPSPYSFIRQRLRGVLVELAESPDAEARPWNYSLNYCIHLLLDHSDILGEYGSEMVGRSLRNWDEFRSLRHVAASLDAITEDRANDLTDAQYLQLPEWPAIKAAVRAALAEFDKP